MWTLGDVRIYVQDKNSSGKQIIARLQPLAGETIQQIFGYEKMITKISCKVVGETNLALIKAFITDGQTHDLVGNGTNYGSFYVASVNEKQNNAIYQTIAGDCTDPLFDVELELT